MSEMLDLNAIEAEARTPHHPQSGDAAWQAYSRQQDGTILALIAMARGLLRERGVWCDACGDGVVPGTLHSSNMSVDVNGLRCGLCNVATSPVPSCSPPSPAEGSERARKIEAAARTLRGCQVALDAWTGADVDDANSEGAMESSWEKVNAALDAANAALDLALALPAGPPESDGEVLAEVAEAVRDAAAQAVFDATPCGNRQQACDAARSIDVGPSIARVLARRGR